MAQAKINLSDYFEEVPCPQCRQMDASVIYPADLSGIVNLSDLQRCFSASSDQALQFQLCQCRNCHMQYVSPRPKEQIIMDGYSAGEDQRFVAQNEMRIKTFKRQFKRLLRELNWENGQGKSFLDIGCGGGASLVAGSALGFDSLGVEPNKWLSAYARERYNVAVHTGVVPHVELENRHFDMVSLWDVLEHLHHPDRLLAQVADLLKPKGAVIVSVPDSSSLVARLMGRRWPFLLNVHLLYYTKKTIRSHLHKHGFEVITMYPLFQTLYLGYIFERAAKTIRVVKGLAALSRLLGLYHLPLTYQLGQTVIVARKR